MKEIFHETPRTRIHLIQSCEDESTQYLELPDGLRLIFRDSEYDGWYVCKENGNAED